MRECLQRSKNSPVARIAVVGGEGFIGAHLVCELLDSNAEVLSIDAGENYGRRTEPALQQQLLGWRRRRLLSDAECVRADARARKALRGALSALAPSHVI